VILEEFPKAPSSDLFRLPPEVPGKERLKSVIHHRKPKGRPILEAMSNANGRRSKIRSAIEHVFVRHKEKLKLFIRTIGINRAKAKIGMATFAYNMLRYVYHEEDAPPHNTW
jgi:hypothetical protein